MTKTERCARRRYMFYGKGAFLTIMLFLAAALLALIVCIIATTGEGVDNTSSGYKLSFGVISLISGVAAALAYWISGWRKWENDKWWGFH